MDINGNDYLNDEMVSIDKNKIDKNNLIMNHQKFLVPKLKTDKEKLKEFAYCMKMMALTQQGFNLINYSRWGKEKMLSSGMNSILKYKHNKAMAGELYRKLDMLMYLKALKGVLFIKTKLCMIDLAKRIFMLDLEQGLEVVIHNELQNQNYPMSYRYYDFILNYAHKNFSHQKLNKYTFESS